MSEGHTAVLSRREFTVAGLLLASGFGAACFSTACGTGSPGSRERPSTLRIGQYWPPVSLDPAKTGAESSLYHSPVYEPLIYRAADGSYQPRLAESWRYLGSGNKTFEISLRPGVSFSDGNDVNAEALKASIGHFRQAAGQAAAFLAPISAMDVTGPLTLRLTLSEPHPQLPALFTQDFLAGNVISPAAVAKPDLLATQSFGAGPYVLLPGETVASDHYTYAVNPKYWNPRERHYEKITIKVLPNENTALAALKTEQVDVIAGSYAIADGAKSAGMRITSSPNIVMGIQLNDREGTLSPPLKDIRVRQALNFAIDRVKITKALLGDYGIPTEQPAAPGEDGYNETNFYSHDPDKARRMLAEAGYPNGFDLPAVIPSAPAFPSDIAQAMASELEKAGVRLKITTRDPATAASELPKFPASIMGWGVLPVYFMGRGLWLRNSIGMNPFHSSDPVLEDLDRQAAAADGETRARLDRQIVRRVVELGWFLPVCLSPVFLFSRDTVKIDSVAGKPFPSVVSWHPAG
jgi:ABC-type transport system substrate-binding protein